MAASHSRARSDTWWGISHAIQHDNFGIVVSFLRPNSRAAKSTGAIGAAWTRLVAVGWGRLYLLDLRQRMKQVTFYHSAICPRCFIARRFVNQLVREYPGIEIESVEFLTSRQRAKNDSVALIPALVCGEKRLSGFYLTKRRIQEFFESL